MFEGIIAADIHAGTQGHIYAAAGASVISCLTEPTWFKGTLQDLSEIRESIDSLEV
jgi:indole-3-glycerol phosphate synthase